MIPVSRPHLSRLFIVAAVTALLALHAWLAVSATIDLGVTGDETVHLTGGYSYWKFNDYRLHPENGNLPQRWATLPLLLTKPYLDPNQHPDLWIRSDVWQIGQTFFFESGNSIDFTLLLGRCAMVMWSVATGLLVFFWSRHLWGEVSALFSLTLFVFSPTMLAHGPLVTSDMCAAFWLLAGTWSWWRLTERYSHQRLVISLVTLGCAVVAKFSFVLLVPIFAVISLWRMFSPHAFAIKQGQPSPHSSRWKSRSRSVLGLAVLHAGFSVLVVWLFFGFRFSAFADGLPRAADFFAPTEGILPSAGWLRSMFEFTFQHQLLPQAFLHGFAYVVYAARERGSFLAGDYGSTGWWWFFPFAFVVKSSLAELAAAASLFVLGPLRAWRNRIDWPRRLEPTLPLLIFAVVYGFFSLTSHLNIGQRHILPLYPVLFILSGAIPSKRPSCFDNRDRDGEVGLFRRADVGHLGPIRGLSSGGIALAGGIAILLVFESLSVRPDYLAFFNQLAGGPENGWRLLGDSSLDWGQNLPKLARWLRGHQQPDEPVYISNFGADDPFYEGIKGRELAPYYSFRRKLIWQPLEAGLFCIGTSMLQDASSAFRGPWTRGREAYYQKLRSKIESEISRGRSPVFGVGVSNDAELLTLDRARFARLCMLLRARTPDAVIGHTIRIYRLNAEEVRRAERGTLEELIALTQGTVRAGRVQGN